MSPAQIGMTLCVKFIEFFSVLQCGLKKARVGGFKSFLLISYSTWGDDPI